MAAGNARTGRLHEAMGRSPAMDSCARLLRSPRCIVSIDIDCFYAQCEELRYPHLKGKHVAELHDVACVLGAAHLHVAWCRDELVLKVSPSAYSRRRS